MIPRDKIKIAIIGMGYVGLPLARLFATKYPVVGFDVNTKRVNELQMGKDSTLEVDVDLLKGVLCAKSDMEKGLYFTNKIQDLSACNYYIISVPTPVDLKNQPDLSSVYQASETVGKVLSKGDIVIYESTVYPGATEEECVPILERVSKLIYNSEFFVGYSPERINPGDTKHTVDKILKVTSGSTQESAWRIDQLYSSVIDAGTHLAPSIKVAEAAKVIENAQRDINIAFVNELAKIFKLLDINTRDVLEAAKTKWNFLPFTPGLAGGHCIGVDPFYLAYKAQQAGYNPEIILAGRKMNDSMGYYVAEEVMQLMQRNQIDVHNAEILVLGITFKENCPDVRNSKAVDVIAKLGENGANITIYDPWALSEEVREEYGLNTITELPVRLFDAAIHVVAHRQFRAISIRSLLKTGGVLYDVKGCLEEKVDGSL